MLGRAEEKGAPLSEVSYILDSQSPFIEYDDYIWRTEWEISDFQQNTLGRSFSFPDFFRSGRGEFFELGDDYMFLPYIMP